jgi:hypothetical protein
MPILIRAARQLAPFPSAPILTCVAHRSAPFGAYGRASFDRGTFGGTNEHLFGHPTDEQDMRPWCRQIVLQVSCLLVRHTSLSIGSITNARDAVKQFIQL